MDLRTKYLIVGNSIAAVSAAEAIRAVDREGNCTIVTLQGKKIYSRPMLTHLVAGELQENDILFRKDDFYDRLNLRIMDGRKVVQIDPENLTATTHTGEKISFEKALITTGSNARTLNIEGMDSKGVCFFHTLEDARQILNTPDGDGNAVVIGAGLIGIRAVFALQARGMKVSIVEMMDRIMPTIMDSTGSDILAKALQARGADVFLNTTVEKVLVENGRVNGVLTEKGDRIPCSLLLITAGVTPNADLARDSGIEVGRGIVVDPYMQTNKVGIYAAGDVVEFPDLVTGGLSINANWPNAAIQGGFAGANMSGVKKQYDGSIGMNSIECGGVPCITMGLVNPTGEGFTVRSHAAPENQLYKKLVFKNGRVAGAVLIGQIQQAGMILKLINEKIVVSGIENDVLTEGKGWFDLIRGLYKEELEGNVDWPESISSQEFYEKKFNDEKWREREEGRREW
jgi:NAD(P)H-nitrite reductase large subunit